LPEEACGFFKSKQQTKKYKQGETTMTIKNALAAVAVLGGVTAFQMADAHAENTVKLCTGVKDGNYDFSGLALQEMIKGSKLELVNSEGAWDNMQKIKDGTCDAAIAQEDAVIAFNRTTNLSLVPLADLYKESLHLVCNPQSGIDELYDLSGTQKTIALGKTGSGAWVTWKNLVDADKSFASVVPTTESGKLAASQVKQGLIDCFLSVSGVASASLNAIDENYGFPDTVLVEVDSSKLLKHKGMSGNPLYTTTNIEEDTYKKWTGNNTWGDDSVDTVGVIAKVVAGKDVSDDDQINLLSAIEKALPGIKKHVAPKLAP